MTLSTTVRLDHLQRLTGPHGLFEHALYDVPRQEHGYTVDDNARAVVLLARAGLTDFSAFETYLEFVGKAFTPRGWRNRMGSDGRWRDQLGPHDTTGRAFWCMGEAAAAGWKTGVITERLRRIADFRTHHLRALSYAMLGAVSSLRAGIAPDAMTTFLTRADAQIPTGPSRDWPWPETRLTYANARIPQALIVGGHAIGNRAMQERGVELLDWLATAESGPQGFSFTPVGGRGPLEVGPAFDQQPIEAWSMADACAAAFAVTNDGRWRRRVRSASLWFEGENDVGAVLVDEATGAGYDGLHADGVNQNRGAESTLAALGARLAWLEVA